MRTATKGTCCRGTLDEVRRTRRGSSCADVGGALKACAELAPLSAASGRSAFARRRRATPPRGRGRAAGRRAARARRRRPGSSRSARSRTTPRFFVRQNFSIVPHVWLPEKIATDCPAARFPAVRPARHAAAAHGRRRTASMPRPAAPRGRRRRERTARRDSNRDGGVTAPRGFRAAGVACGIKKRRAGGEAPLDLALLVGRRVGARGGRVHDEQAVAAPVVVSREHLAATGGRARGDRDQQRLRQRRAPARRAWPSRASMADADGGGASAASRREVLVASTGVIGVPLDIDKVRGRRRRGRPDAVGRRRCRRRACARS